MKQKIMEQIDILTDTMLRVDPASDEYGKMVKSLAELNAQLLAIEKEELAAETSSAELALKEQAAENSKKEGKWRNILNGVGIMIPAAISVWGACRTFEFEENGSICSFSGRQLLGNIFRNKK